MPSPTGTDTVVSTRLDPQQLTLLSYLLDGFTTRRLASLGVGLRWRCWEIGSGDGSIARWLARFVYPYSPTVDGGYVIATATTPRPGTPTEGVRVVEHDLTGGTIVDGGPFELIHARCVLADLPQRRDIIASLRDALVPGGWLVLDEFDHRAATPVLTGTPQQGALYHRVVTASLRVRAQHGSDLGWALHAHGAMADAGLTAVTTVTEADTWRGGDDGLQLHLADSQRLAAHHPDITVEHLTAFEQLAADPSFTVLSWTRTSTAGQRPRSS